MEKIDSFILTKGINHIVLCAHPGSQPGSKDYFFYVIDNQSTKNYPSSSSKLSDDTAFEDN